ncbi:MAG TPA: hypothetical protein VF587_09015 [Solirubrobacteraceae bacterium]|jgi:uncharacterized delta-60 repeat protein
MRTALRLLLAAVGLGSLLPTGAAAQTGRLDTGFGQGGVATTPMGLERNTDFAMDAAVLSDRRVVVGGTVDNDDGPMGLGLARYLPSGELDPSFGDGGRVVTTRFPSALNAWAMLRQPDGRLLVGGSMCDGSPCDMTVVRYTADGALDGTFGDGGFARVEFPPCGDERRRGTVSDLALDGSGRIVAAGNACTGSSGSSTDAAVIRLRDDGSLDDTFGEGGRAWIDLGDFGSAAASVAVDGQGRIVLGGTTDLGETPNVAARLTPAGRPDPSFDGDGLRLFRLEGMGSIVHQVGVLPDDRVVLGGVAIIDAVAGAWFVRRLAVDGSDDVSYDGDGTAFLRHPTKDAALGMLVAADGSVTLSGQRYEEGRGSHMAVGRLTPSGAVDGAFGDGGVTFIPSAEESLGTALAAGPGGSLVVTGWSGSQEDRYVFATARLLGDGSSSLPPPAPEVGDAPLRIPVRNGARVKLRRNGTFALRLGPFVEQASGRVEMLRGTRRFAARDFTVERYGTVNVRLRASRRVRRLARRRGGVRVSARLTARDVRARYAARRFAFRLVR